MVQCSYYFRLLADRAGVTTVVDHQPAGLAVDEKYVASVRLHRKPAAAVLGEDVDGSTALAAVHLLDSHGIDDVFVVACRFGRWPFSDNARSDERQRFARTRQEPSSR